jgi:hypothetical protein
MTERDGSGRRGEELIDHGIFEHELMRNRTCTVRGVEDRCRRRLLSFAKEQLGIDEVEAGLFRIAVGSRRAGDGRCSRACRCGFRSCGGIQRLFDGQIREQLKRRARRSFHTKTYLSNASPWRRRDGSHIEVEMWSLVTQLTPLEVLRVRR